MEIILLKIVKKVEKYLNGKYYIIKQTFKLSKWNKCLRYQGIYDNYGKDRQCQNWDYSIEPSFVNTFN